jgi:alkanesulfonate monooxygenase SsuD/methylene tetrahydromethanopterin reductase-like flavin-dependent oxidoreductase (luciferase family)
MSADQRARIPANYFENRRQAHVIQSEQEALETAEKYAEYIARDASDRVLDWALPFEEITRLAESGLFGITVPRSHGVLGISAAALMKVFECISAADSAIGQIPNVKHGAEGVTILHNELADPISGLITLSSHLNHDFARYSLDEPIKDVKNNGVRGLYDLAARLTTNGTLTLRDIGRLYAQGVLLSHLVGTPVQIANQLEASFCNGEADGFIISPAYSPGAFEEFVQLVVPEPQRRGLFHREYTGKTLRENLGLAKPSLTSVRESFDVESKANGLVPRQ